MVGLRSQCCDVRDSNSACTSLSTALEFQFHTHTPAVDFFVCEQASITWQWQSVNREKERVACCGDPHGFVAAIIILSPASLFRRRGSYWGPGDHRPAALGWQVERTYGEARGRKGSQAG